MGYPHNKNYGADSHGKSWPTLPIKRKFLRTVELDPDQEFIVPRNQQIVMTKVVHEVLPEKVMVPTYPRYKVIVVLQCVEFEEAN